MEHSFTIGFTEEYRNLPTEIQRKFDKQLKHLLIDIRHPSLQSKKYNKEKDIWQARVNRHYRFYFLIKANTYILLEIKPHPK